MPVQLSTKAVDQSTYLVTASFTNESGAAVTPGALTWTLTDVDGDIINSREDVTITPAATVNVVLSGNDLKIADGIGRIIIFEGTYDSSLDSDLPLVETAFFSIELTPYTYDPDSPVGQVRELIGDTDFSSDAGVKPTGANFTDEQIKNALARNGNDVRATAAEMCDILSVMWAGAAEMVKIGDYQVSSVTKTTYYRAAAKQLRSSRSIIEVY